METIYVAAMLVSTFFHCMGLFYTPIESSADSVLFIFISIIFLHKFKLKNDVEEARNTKERIIECAFVCLIVQVLLLFIWFPVHNTLQIMVDSVCTENPNDQTVDLIKDYTASAVVLAIETAFLLKVMEIDDIQRIYGSKDDLVSESVLAIVAEQEKAVARREARMWRRR